MFFLLYRLSFKILRPNRESTILSNSLETDHALYFLIYQRLPVKDMTPAFDKRFCPSMKKPSQCHPNVLVYTDVRSCVLRLTSWSMCLTDESVEEKLQRIMSGYLAAETVMELLHTLE